MARRCFVSICEIFFACLCACGAPSETLERPPAAAPAPVATRPTAFPATAFIDPSGGAESPASTSFGSRFETRRIGDDEGRSRATRWRGAPITVDVKNADLADVLRLLADVGKVNIVVSGDVGGTVTLKLARVPWDQALDVIARAKNLEVERDGNVILVKPRGVSSPAP